MPTVTSGWKDMTTPKRINGIDSLEPMLVTGMMALRMVSGA